MSRLVTSTELQQLFCIWQVLSRNFSPEICYLEFFVVFINSSGQYQIKDLS
jgi:hypothetical protein